MDRARALALLHAHHGGGHDGVWHTQLADLSRCSKHRTQRTLAPARRTPGHNSLRPNSH